MSHLIVPRSWTSQPLVPARLRPGYRDAAVYCQSAGGPISGDFDFVQQNTATVDRYEDEGVGVYADHGGSVDDRFALLTEIDTAKASPLTTIVVMTMRDSGHDQAAVIRSGHGHMITFDSNELRVGYQGGNGYQYIFRSADGITYNRAYYVGRTFVFVISTDPINKVVTASVLDEGRSVPLVYAFGNINYIGQGSLPDRLSGGYLGETGYVQYYHARGLLRLWAVIPQHYGSREVDTLADEPWQIFERSPLLIPIGAGGGPDDIFGSIAFSDAGPDAIQLAGQVVVSGSYSAVEPGSDQLAAVGQVPIGGALLATESVSDIAAITGGFGVTGSLSAQEPGADLASVASGVLVSGSMSIAEPAPDASALTGAVLVSGTLTAAEAGPDDVSIAGGFGASGALAATEAVADTTSLSGRVDVSGALAVLDGTPDVMSALGRVAVSGAVAAVEASSDALLIVGDASNAVIGGLSAIESSADTAAVAGGVRIVGWLSAAEMFADIAAVVGTVPAGAAALAAMRKRSSNNAAAVRRRNLATGGRRNVN